MFYENLCKLCEQRGLKVTNVISELGYSKGTQSRWRAGSVPNIDILMKFAEFFDVSADELLGRKKHELDGIYLRLGKEAQRMGLDEEDVETIIKLYGKHRKLND
ncbi:MAG: helix-turn-helix domain-containing protein [Oscillospiraceae bacterium]|jgi:transcriptional regulator with XRE-family HTH domain|nr:helix-turn-helix domain-containing protein [Oscillospiraceae bacterium]